MVEQNSTVVLAPLGVAAASASGTTRAGMVRFTDPRLRVLGELWLEYERVFAWDDRVQHVNSRRFLDKFINESTIRSSCGIFCEFVQRGERGSYECVELLQFGKLVIRQGDGATGQHSQ